MEARGKPARRTPGKLKTKTAGGLKYRGG